MGQPPALGRLVGDSRVERDRATSEVFMAGM